MNLLASAIAPIASLVRNQDVKIEVADGVISAGVARPSFMSFDLKAHIQPLSFQEVRVVADGIIGASEYCRVWIFGDRLEVSKGAILQNKETYFYWNGKKYIVFGKMDWSLNGWIEGYIALKERGGFD